MTGTILDKIGFDVVENTVETVNRIDNETRITVNEDINEDEK